MPLGPIVAFFQDIFGILWQFWGVFEGFTAAVVDFLGFLRDSQGFFGIPGAFGAHRCFLSGFFLGFSKDPVKNPGVFKDFQGRV